MIGPQRSNPYDYPGCRDVFSTLPEDGLVGVHGKVYHVDVLPDYVLVEKAGPSAGDTTYWEGRNVARYADELPLLQELCLTYQGAGEGLLLPTPETVNNFSKDYLQSLGTTSMKFAETYGGIFKGGEFIEGFADNTFIVATELDRFMHDMTDHLPTMLMSEQATRIVQRLAQLSISLRKDDPERASELTGHLSGAFHKASSRGDWSLADTSGISCGHITLLRNVFFRLKRLATPELRSSVEKAIDEPPLRSSTRKTYPKAEGWMLWEEQAMPAFDAAVTEQLQRQPQGTRRQRVAELTHIMQ